MLLGTLSRFSVKKGGAQAETYFKKAAPPATVVRSTIQPPADHQFDAVGFDAGAPAISPDGKRLVVSVRDSRGKLSIWLRSLNDIGEGRVLPGTDDGSEPFWSPDGRSIGFFADGKLKRIDTDGSNLQALCDASSPGGGAWSVGGIILLSPAWRSGLYQIPANGGTPRQVTEPNTGRGEFSHRWPVFLADGRHFLFLVASNQATGIYAGSLDSKDYHPVVGNAVGPAFETGGTIVYVRDGAVMAQAFDERKLATMGEPVLLPDH